jgi:hypothetical protein
VLYGRAESIAELSQRRRGRSGDAAHEAAVLEQAQAIEAQTAAGAELPGGDVGEASR